MADQTYKSLHFDMPFAADSKEAKCRALSAPALHEMYAMPKAQTAKPNGKRPREDSDYGGDGATVQSPAAKKRARKKANAKAKAAAEKNRQRQAQQLHPHPRSPQHQDRYPRRPEQPSLGIRHRIPVPRVRERAVRPGATRAGHDPRQRQHPRERACQFAALRASLPPSHAPALVLLPPSSTMACRVLQVPFPARVASLSPRNIVPKAALGKRRHTR